MAGGGVGEAMLISAALGGVSSAAAGGDPLKGALLGGITGGIGSGIAGALGAGAEAAGTAAATTAAPVSEAMMPQTLLQGAQTSAFNPTALGLESTYASPGIGQLGSGTAGMDLSSITGTPAATAASMSTPLPAGIDSVAPPATTTQPGFGQRLMNEWNALPASKQLLYGGMGTMGLASLMNRPAGYKPKHYDPFFTSFRPSVQVAGGGVMKEADYLPGTGTDENFFADGGIASLGGYSDGGRLLKGPGDGMSDNIPAQIGQRQPARLADGEFVVPADIVSHLGNGSTDAGARQLYSMMDRVRKSRTGTSKQGRQINPRKMLPV